MFQRFKKSLIFFLKDFWSWYNRLVSLIIGKDETYIPDKEIKSIDQMIKTFDFSTFQFNDFFNRLE